MPHWKLTLAYDGTLFHGWQIQPNLPTIQGTLAQTIHRITGESVLPQGSGRTDTGVHALAQVASFTLNAPIPAANFHRALNRALPPSIRILSVEEVPADFHARHSAQRKTYEYRISTDEICSPMLAPYVWNCHLSLNPTTLQQAATHILGTHDFTSFAASDPDQTTREAEVSTEIPTPSRTSQNLVISTEGGASAAEAEKPASLPHLSPIPNSPLPPTPCLTRTIYHSSWHHHDTNLLIYRITGSGFLHHMVRNLVGTFVEAGANRIPADSIPAILAARNRNAAGPTAPARGLFLVEVEY
jgi:tRNA pseudouridine38-40 synthase